MSDKSCRSWIMVSVVSRYSVESETSRPRVPLRLAMRDITLSADTSTRTRLSWFLCAASSRSRKSWDAERKFTLVVAELLRIVASWPWVVAESTLPRVVWKLAAALAGVRLQAKFFWSARSELRLGIRFAFARSARAAGQAAGASPPGPPAGRHRAVYTASVRPRGAAGAHRGRAEAVYTARFRTVG